MAEQWERLGEDLARNLVPAGQTSGRRAAGEIRAALRKLDRLRRRQAGREEQTQAAEWLLDNWYVAQREGLEGMRALRSARRLRFVQQAGGRELYVLELCRALAGTAEPLDAAVIAAFLAGVQSVRPLTEGELAHFFPALRGALVLQLLKTAECLDRGEEVPAEVMEQIFASLRALSAPGLWKLLEQASIVDQVLRRDPAGAYPGMEDATRAQYRSTLCMLARRYGMSEAAAADLTLRLAQSGDGERRHVGYYLYRRPLGRQNRQNGGTLYVAGILLPTLFLVLLIGFHLHSWLVTVLLLLPVSDIIKNLMDFLVVRLVPPRPVSRMALEGGIPEDGRTLCVIAGLLTDNQSGPVYAALLERYRLANRDAGKHLLMGLLADLPDRDTPVDGRARGWIREANRAVAALNEKYGGGFYLFFREPVFQPGEERYQGWERKRGALLELCRLLRGKRTGVRVEEGDRRCLRGVKLVITLDSDTSLNVGTARELAGAMLHPLNRPAVDPRRRIVTAGYGVLQPRVGVELGSANRSWFSRIFAGQGGVDPYGGTCSDVYHDLFDQGTYTGKGIFDVDAFLTCLDGRFPENRILSHDLIEGSYLHCGLLGDIELTDGYPYKVTSYFARLHRWVRGDWQLLPWLSGTVKNQAGRREANPISSVAKWKIFDNLRRSLSPVCTLLALILGMCLHRTDFGWAAGIAVIAAASHLLLSGAELAWRGGKGLRERYHSTIVSGLGGAVLQTLLQLLFLPLHAWICFSAICTSLWRQLVSHRNLLAWVTASVAEQRAGNGLWANVRKQWPAVVIGLAAMLFSRFPAGAAAGLLWMLSPVFSWALSRPIREGRRVAAADRPFLLHQGALIWRYFEDFLRPEDHWLPPDNWQEQPPVGLARRTSPTNIGMALLSVMAAADLEYISQEKAINLLSHTISTLEILPKWRGHLYNWYDTSELSPLYPRYVSTVDSGNLCACLVALREGLYQWGAAALARRAEALSDAMDFSGLYDRERRLFYIGYDLEKEEYTQGWYDLLASEARQTSYLAVARGEVEPRHWRRLSRTLTADGDYRGMASWTGTMFEYFMPNLLMPLETNSLLYESLCFCVWEQRRRTAGKYPWGISESCFYAFDPGMSYQYKAHGVQRLGLKRGLDCELVIAPYASFLSLPAAPSAAVKNLRRLRELGAEGMYGLCEALDFTPSRLTGDRPFEPVRTYMSHHLGMSLVAIDNALRENVMVRRFMADCNMMAYRELLQEKVPVGAVVLKSQTGDAPERPRRITEEGVVREGIWTGEGRPACHLLSNGQINCFCAADGSNRTVWREFLLTGGDGISCYLYAEGAVSPLTPNSWRFDGGASWTTETEGFTALRILRTAEKAPGVSWEVRLRRKGNEPLPGELVLYLEPILARERDFEAHPAYVKLFVESAYTGDGIVFARRPRRQGEPVPALAVVWDAETAFFDTSRESALGRGGLSALPQALRRQARSSAGAVLDPCLLLRIPLTLSPGRTSAFRFALAISYSGEEALEEARALLHEGTAGTDKNQNRLIELCSLTGETALQAFELLKVLAYPGELPNTPQSDLWPYGVSGDYPIALIRAASREEAEKHAFWLGCHKFLTHLGYPFDLVILLEEGGDYRRPARSLLFETLRELHWDHMQGARAGIHLLQGPAPALEAAAIAADGPYPPFKNTAHTGISSFLLDSGSPLWETKPDGTFTLHCGPRLPPLGWSQMLTNGGLGWMPDETGCGHLWLGNARECQLTPWCNDPLQIGGPEYLSLLVGEEERSLFAAADGLPCDVTYGPGFARWTKKWGEHRTVLTACIPMEQDVRILLLEMEGTPAQVKYRHPEGTEHLFPIREAIAILTDSGGVTRTGDVREAKKMLNRTVMHWNRTVSALKFHTPDEALDNYLNGWALYQVMACRLMGRTSRYQNGGAYGFRDQLQDACAVLFSDGTIARTQIRKACAHQFEEGDVLHWWHETPGAADKGVRTRISDDLLWLPYALCEYLEKLGDDGLADEIVPYLTSRPLEAEEQERYEHAEISRETGRVYDHACRAADLVLERGTGEHGLLLMGAGDWNDGMNRVGAAGKGESVWLSWFAAHVLGRLAALCAARGDGSRAESYRAAAEKLRSAAGAAWDGDWFLRGYYDDATPLGGRQCDECRIDSIAQSWAVLAGSGEERAQIAVRSALEALWDQSAGLVRLFTPAFDDGEKDPGYIKGYLPGVRENGGQYTHAAVWLALACLELGMTSEGYGILKNLLPAHHDPEIYKAEPYVLAADVYDNPAHRGRGGWSWYTGAAGWYYRTATEYLLGLKLRAGRLSVEPKLPPDWPGFTAVWRTEQATLRISVSRGKEKKSLLDGEPVQEGIPIRDLSGEHKLEVVIQASGSI